MNNPGISIVIASKGRTKLLGELLESVFVARENYSSSSEVLVVDDSNPLDAEIIKAHCETYNCRLISFGPSVSGKRNLGAKEASYELLLFLDSDCLATSHLLEEHAKCYEDNKVGGVAGPLEFVGEDTWFWKAVEKSPYVICFGFANWLETVPWTPSANFSVRRQLFHDIGGFDEGFPNKPGGEDVDLGLRITKQGFYITCAKEALVYHSKSTWAPIKDMFRRLWHYGSADCYLLERHPDYGMSVLPRRFLVYCSGLFLLFAYAAFSSWWLLLFWPAWVLVDLALTSLMINKFASYKRADFLQQMAVQVMMLTNEIGYIFRCLRRNKPGFLFRQMVYFDGQMKGIQHNGAINMWSLLTGVAMLVIAICII